jgi:hypothetical protein
MILRRTHAPLAAGAMISTEVITIALITACSAPRRVQEPIEYPADVKLECSTLQLDVVDPRIPGAPGSAPGARQLAWPSGFEARAQSHLARITSGQGPALAIAGRVGAADEIELVDSRGEITRINVALHFDVNLAGGPLVRRAEAHSSYDIPRNEATPEEIEIVLDGTALDAFDRYWANPATLTSLNRELVAVGERLGDVPPAAPSAP